MNGNVSPSPDKTATKDDFCKSLGLALTPSTSSTKYLLEPGKNVQDEGAVSITGAPEFGHNQVSVDDQPPKKSYDELAAELAALKQELNRLDELYEKRKEFATVIEDENELLKLEIQDVKKYSDDKVIGLEKKIEKEKQRNGMLGKTLDEIDEQINYIKRQQQFTLKPVESRRRTRSFTNRTQDNIPEAQLCASKTAFQQTGMNDLKPSLSSTSLYSRQLTELQLDTPVSMETQVKIDPQAPSFH